MTTLSEKTDLMHDPSKMEKNNALFDHLRHIFFKMLHPAVEEALHKNGVINREDEIDTNTTNIYAKSLTTTIISTWLNHLHARSKSDKALTHSFHPDSKSDIRMSFENTVSPFHISEDTILKLFPALLSQLPLTEDGNIELPLGLHITPTEYNEESQPISYLIEMHND